LEGAIQTGLFVRDGDVGAGDHRAAFIEHRSRDTARGRLGKTKPGYQQKQRTELSDDPHHAPSLRKTIEALEILSHRPGGVKRESAGVKAK
jgi:hypothetical protein